MPEQIKKINQIENLSEILGTPQGRAMSTGLGSLLITVILFFFAITPAFSSINSQIINNEALERRNVLLETKYNSIINLQRKQAENSDKLEKFDKIIGFKKNQDLIYKELLSFAEGSGINFVSIRFEDNTIVTKKYEPFVISPKFAEQKIRFSGIGIPENVYLLIDKIEKSTRAYDVDDIAISAIKDEGTGQNASIDVTMRSYYWLEEI